MSNRKARTYIDPEGNVTAARTATELARALGENPADVKSMIREHYGGFRIIDIVPVKGESYTDAVKWFLRFRSEWNKVTRRLKS